MPGKFLTVWSSERRKFSPLATLPLRKKNHQGEKTGTTNHNQKNPKSIMRINAIYRF